MARARARAERFAIQLPPLDSMYAVQSALSQLAEALAADMIELKRAHALMSLLRLMSLNFRHPEKWQSNLYHSDQSPTIDVTREFGLPRDLDLDTSPEVAFPQPEFTSMQDAEATDNCPLATDNQDFRPDSPVSPEFLELRDISTTHGSEAAGLRFRQLQRNRVRRALRSDRQRYADLALRLNLKKAAESLAERRVAEKLAEAGIAPPASEPFDFERAVADSMKKTAVSLAEIDACLAAREVKIA